MDERGARREDRRGLGVGADRRVDGRDAARVGARGDLALEQGEPRGGVAQGELERPSRGGHEPVEVPREDLGPGEDEVALARRGEERAAGEGPRDDGHQRRRVVEGVRAPLHDAVEEGRGTVVRAAAEGVEGPHGGARDDGEARRSRGARRVVDDRRKPLPRERLQRLPVPVGDETVAAPAEQVDDHETSLAEDLDDLRQEELVRRAPGRRAREGEVETGAGRGRPAVGFHVEREGVDPGDVPRRGDEGVEARLRQGCRRDGHRLREGPLRHREAVPLGGLPRASPDPTIAVRPPSPVKGTGGSVCFVPFAFSISIRIASPARAASDRRNEPSESASVAAVACVVSFQATTWQPGQTAPGAPTISTTGCSGSPEGRPIVTSHGFPSGGRQVFGLEGRDEVGRLPGHAVDEPAPGEVPEAAPEGQDEGRVPRERPVGNDDDGARPGRGLDACRHGDGGTARGDDREDDALGRDGERVERLGEVDGEAREDGDGRARGGRDRRHPGGRRDDAQLDARDLRARRRRRDAEGGEVARRRLDGSERLRAHAEREGEESVALRHPDERPAGHTDVQVRERSTVEAEETPGDESERFRGSEECVGPLSADTGPGEDRPVDRPRRESRRRVVPRRARHRPEDDEASPLLQRDEEEVLARGRRRGEPRGHRGGDGERRSPGTDADRSEEGEPLRDRDGQVGRPERREGDGNRGRDRARRHAERPSRAVRKRSRPRA